MKTGNFLLPCPSGIASVLEETKTRTLASRRGQKRKVHLFVQKSVPTEAIKQTWLILRQAGCPRNYIICWIGCCLIHAHQTYRGWGRKRDSWLKKMSAGQRKWRNLLLNILKKSCVGILCLISLCLLHTCSATCLPWHSPKFQEQRICPRAFPEMNTAWLRTSI